MAIRKPTETDIVRACLDYLRLCRWLAWRSNTGAATYTGANGRTRLVRFGEPGVSDILAVAPGGRLVAIECKSDRGRLRESQAAFLDRVREAGGLPLVVRSVSELQHLLQEAGYAVP